MKKLLSIILFAGWGVSLFAAGITTQLPKKCEAFRPDILYQPMFTESHAKILVRSGDYGQSKSARGENGHEFWIVFSDRDNNTTYTAPNSRTAFKQLDFNEKVRIAQIKDGWALVYYEPKEQETYPRFSSEIEWKGWVKMDKLLLWNTCPANDNGIYYKAMLCANLDEKVENDRLGKCFKNPDNLKVFEDLRVDFTYYFVMKTEGNMVLLAYQNTMNGQTYRVLYGWVDKNSFVSWNQRSCLEPNWDIQDVEYFAKNGVKAYIYDDKGNKASYIEYQKKKSNTYDPDMYRMNGDVLRYPILDDNSEKYWNCSTFSAPGDGAINAGSNDQRRKNTLQSNLDELSKINIVFVMDGTRSMETFYPAIKQTIREINKYYPPTWNVKVGFLIYRDKKDGEYVTEMVPLTNPDNEKLSTWLSKGGEYGIRSGGGDSTMEEALYYGIDKALETFNFNPRESNMMFVIGDCGDAGDYPEITEQSLVNKLVEKNVTLMGFQVRNSANDSAFPLFNSNVSTLILNSLQEKYAKLVREDSRIEGDVEVKVKMKRNEYEFSNNAQNAEGNLFIGSHKYVQSGVLKADELQAQVISAATAIKEDVDHKLQQFYNAQNNVWGTGTFSNHFKASDFEITGPRLDDAWLRSRVGDEVYNALRNNNTTVSFRGYTLKQDAGEHDYYKTVIFISQQELNTMMSRLAPLYEVAQRKGDDREPYVKAMRALVQGMIPNISNAEIDAKGYDEVIALVAGLNVQTNALKGRTITEVASKKAVSAQEYQSIINKFKRQYQKLQRIQKQPYDFVREFNGAKYYWIPTEDLP